MGSARRCKYAIDISESNHKTELNAQGPVSIAQYSVPFFAIWKSLKIPENLWKLKIFQQKKTPLDFDNLLQWFRSYGVSIAASHPGVWGSIPGKSYSFFTFV